MRRPLANSYNNNYNIEINSKIMSCVYLRSVPCDMTGFKHDTSNYVLEKSIIFSK